MYTRLLVALDGSETAEQVLPYARALARCLKVPVELLAVIAAGVYGPSEKTRFLDGVREDATRSSATYLGRVAQTLTGTNVECSVKQGPIDESIISTAAADRGTLIAMTTHGRSGLNRWLLGSVAERVLRSTTNPLLVARAKEGASPDGEASLRSLIVALDGSELAESVLPHAVELAKACALTVTLLRSYSANQMVLRFQDYTPDVDEFKEELKWEAMSYLEDILVEMKSQGLTDVFPYVTEGDAAEMIIEYAKRTPDSLIAICTHGRSGVTRWVLGSVTEKVLRHSENPVLVIRGRKGGRFDMAGKP